MSLEALTHIHPKVQDVLKELQGLKMSLATGQAADTNVVIPGIRPHDTIKFALNNNGGTLTEITPDLTIADGRAFGTITMNAPNAADTVTLNGLTYTAVNGTPADNTEFDMSGDDTATAASLRDAINSRDGTTILATSDAAVVTAKAVSPGVAGNSIDLAESTGGARMTVSGANLANGTGDFASQTITCASVVAGDWVKVRGRTYTGVANGTFQTAKWDTFDVGTTNNECAANLAASINGRDGDVLEATANADVVTVKFKQQSEAGNNVKLESSGATLTLGGSTLSGGAFPGGAVRSPNLTNQVLLFWADKK